MEVKLKLNIASYNFRSSEKRTQEIFVPFYVRSGPPFYCGPNTVTGCVRYRIPGPTPARSVRDPERRRRESQRTYPKSTSFDRTGSSTSATASPRCTLLGLWCPNTRYCGKRLWASRPRRVRRTAVTRTFRYLHARVTRPGLDKYRRCYSQSSSS